MLPLFIQNLDLKKIKEKRKKYKSSFDYISDTLSYDYVKGLFKIKFGSKKIYLQVGT